LGLVGCIGWDKLRVALHLKFFRRKKDDDPCWHEQVVLVGFSDGATSIWQLFGEHVVKNELRSRRYGGIYKAAYAGFMDMVRTSFWDINSDKFKRDTKEEPLADEDILVAGNNFYQLDDPKMKGHVRIGDVPVPKQVFGVSHKGTKGLPPILKSIDMEALKARAVETYVAREPYDSPDVPRRPVVD
jgi:hypothetical protein